MILREDNTAFVVVCGIALSLAFLDFPANTRYELILLVTAVVALGLPHGALDAWYAEDRGFSGDGWRGSLAFYLAYVSLATVTAIAWLLFPATSLCFFLAISAWHFSGDWRDVLTQRERLTAGLTLVSLPALFHPESVELLYEALAVQQATKIVTAQTYIALVSGTLLMISTLRVAPKHPHLLLEISLILVCAWALAPITFFLVYFCGLHSIRHMLRLLDGVSYKVGISALVHCLLAVLAALAVWKVAPAALTIDEYLLSAVFIGLAALTVPHMLIHDVLDPAQRRAAS